MSYASKAEGLASAIQVLVHNGVDDAHCYRNLIDNLHAYRIGAVNRTGKWDTRRIKAFCRWTIAARVQGHGHLEHVVPMAVLLKLLGAEPLLDVDRVVQIVDQYSVYCVVTPAEHERLNCGYQRSMPAGFWQPDSPCYMDPWARYAQCGIAVEPAKPAAVAQTAATLVIG